MFRLVAAAVIHGGEDNRTESMDDRREITLADVRAAYPEVRHVAHHTPVFHCTSLAERAGIKPEMLMIKMENLQRTGSFKIRGAFNRLRKLSLPERDRGIVAASAGNHAQGVALAARLLGTHSIIVMPEFASISKIQATRHYGAEVILRGSNFDEAVEAGRALASETGEAFIPAYDENNIIEGQGTLGLEIFEDVPNVDTVAVPVGGGGLISGVALTLRALRPTVRVIGVQAVGASSAVESWRTGELHRSPSVNTIAEGIAIKGPSERTFHYLRRYVDDMVTVEDREIAAAILVLLEFAKTVVEPAGAVGIAALMAGRLAANSKTVVIVSGGNIDGKFLADLIEREMIHANRYMHFFTAVTDRPGGLAALLEQIAILCGNVISVVHDRISPTVPLGQTGVELLIEVRDAEHIEQIHTGLTSRGYLVKMLN